MSLLYGESHVGFDPRTIQDSNCVLIWGANPSHSGPHSHKHWFAASKAKKIVVDPLRTNTARAADIHLQLYPGTDAALAYSLLHVMQREGLFNDDFISLHTIGSDELLPVINHCTPEWGEQETGVPAALIEEAARCYAAGPSLLWLGQGFQRQLNGGNCMRAAGLLPAFTGNIGKAGAGFTYVTHTPASDYRLNDSYANDPKLARNAGEAGVYIHPEDAERLNVGDGARVNLSNGNGDLNLNATIGEISVPGVLVSYKGRWPKKEKEQKNVNVLHIGQKADVAGSTSVHSTLVSLTPDS